MGVILSYMIGHYDLNGPKIIIRSRRKLNLIFVQMCFLLIVPWSGLFAQENSGTQVDIQNLCDDISYRGIEEIESVFQSIPKNQGLTNDGEHFYVSPDHSTIEKRSIHTYKLIASAHYPDQIGGLFYDVERNEILTCSGEYETDGKAYITRIDKNTLDKLETIEISEYTNHGVNAIVRLGDKIYVGETAVNDDMKPKSWYSFDTNFNFIEPVFSHESASGNYDWQDATVSNGIIYASDHNGFVFAFCVASDGQFTTLGNHDSAGKYYEGMTIMDHFLFIWKSKVGIVSARFN